jgi:hypothetical protein
VKFTGEVRIPEIDHPGVPATFLIEDNQAEVVLEGESLGRWSLFDVHARRLVSSAFQVEFEDEEVTFIADEPIDFAYRGVEHMAEVWAKYKAMNVARRVVAVKRSRRGVKPSKIEELRQAMLANVDQQPGSALAGEAVATAPIDAESVATEIEGLPSARAATPDPEIPVAPIPEIPPAGETTGDTQERIEAERREAELMKARQDEAARLEAERKAIESERARLEQEKQALEEQRRAAEQKEADRIAAFKLEMERLERERAEAAEKEAERQAALEAEKQRLEAEKAERERVANEKVQAAQEEAARLDAQRAEMERLEAERAERERLAADQVQAAQEEAARLDAKRAEMERLEAERAERERLAAEQAKEAEEQAARLEAKRAEMERLEAERVAAAQAELKALEEKRAEVERLAAERAEQERADQEKLAEVQAEMERLAAEKAQRLASEDADVPKEPKEEVVKEILETGPDSDDSVSSKQLVVDLGELEEPGEEKDRTPVSQEPALAGAQREKSGIMGAVMGAFGRSGKNHDHDFVEAPGGIGIARSICRECGYVSISSSD